MWRLNYLRRPYLKDASDGELAQRLRDIIENITVLTTDGKVSLLSPEPHGKVWLELAAHAQEAYRGRGQPPPNFLEGAMVPRPTYPSPPRAVTALKDLHLPPVGTYLVKFGRREHMLELYENGSLRISPASRYNDPSLNGAIRDEEVSVSAFALKAEVQMTVIDHKTGIPNVPITPLGNVRVTSTATCNYYVCCLAQILDIRLFDNFGYDACVILTQPDDFRRRVNAAMEERLKGWSGFDRPITYIDPYNCKRDDLSVFFGKHFRYWYQREYRFAWLPPDGYSSQLDPIDLHIGPLRESAALVVL